MYDLILGVLVKTVNDNCKRFVVPKKKPTLLLTNIKILFGSMAVKC